MDRRATSPTLYSRRVTHVPAELAPTLNVAKMGACLHCAGTPALFSCPDCQLHLYCSDECCRQHRTAHKADEYCDQIAALHDSVDDTIRQAFSHPRQQGYRRHGCLSEDPHWKPNLDCESDRAFKLARHPTLAQSVEESLNQLVILKRRTYLADVYHLDARIVGDLVRLYREDDAVSFILYWLEWRSRGPDLDNLQDDLIDGCLYLEWPFPLIEDARLLDITDKFRRFPQQHVVGTSVPLEFALALLVIKVRFICVYRTRVEAAVLYWSATGLGALPRDARWNIMSFLVAGGRERYVEQMNHAHCLMDYIDERDATLLPALIDPSILPQRNEVDGDQVHFDSFLDEYANGKPVVRTIRSILTKRYMQTMTVTDEPRMSQPECTTS